MGTLKPQFIVKWWYKNDRSRDSHEQKSVSLYLFNSQNEFAEKTELINYWGHYLLFGVLDYWGLLLISTLF